MGGEKKVVRQPMPQIFKKSDRHKLTQNSQATNWQINLNQINVLYANLLCEPPWTAFGIKVYTFFCINPMVINLLGFFLFIKCYL